MLREPNRDTLLAEVWVVNPHICVYGRADTISHHFGGGIGIGYIPSSSLPITVLGRSLR